MEGVVSESRRRRRISEQNQLLKLTFEEETKATAAGAGAQEIPLKTQPIAKRYQEFTQNWCPPGRSRLLHRIRGRSQVQGFRIDT